ncbi:VasL domain-containing protein [Pantoea sp. 1.19]|uniref:VasL domain-containing protein n=1 Tax=Pantoea sp. 1.19 TaxID=1925589 RepID=UPI000948BBBB|nr:VasL domain-containing protein [Pantoea sp. 1.19]
MDDATNSILIKAGGDPRARPEFNALRQQINHLHHAADSPVNWAAIEALSLQLFRRHGIDLQTAVWYALARAQQQHMAGFAEGCELLASLMINQWDHLWPTQAQARSDILSWFCAQMAALLRRHPLHHDDRRAIYRAEHALQLLSDRLRRVALVRAPRVDALLLQVQHCAAWLDGSPDDSAHGSASLLTIPPPALRLAGRFAQHPASVSGDGATAGPPARWRSGLWSFLAGLACGLVVTLSVWLWQVLPLQQRWSALAARPAAAAQQWLLTPQLTGYGHQMAFYTRASPLSPLAAAEQTVRIARQRWPDNPLQLAITARWQRLQQARRAAAGDLQRYVTLKMHLRTLADALAAQERQPRDVAFIWLKNTVWQVQRDLAGDPPLEALLGQLAAAVDKHQAPSPQLRHQIDARWHALQAQYYQLCRRADALGGT